MDSLNCLNKSTIVLLHKNNLLFPLIKSEIQNRELSNIKISKDSKIEALQKFLKQQNLPDQKSFEKWKEINNLNDSEVENLALNEIKLKKYCKDKFIKKADSRFLERKSDLDIIVYSLLRVKDSDKARELYLRIDDKEAEFSELASKYSEGIEKKTCGIVGPIPISSAHPILIKHLQNKPLGEVQPPIKIEDSYIIVRVESYEPAKLDNFMREKMSLELFNNWLVSKSQDICQKLLEKLETNDQVWQE